MNLPIPNKETYLKAKPFPHLVIDQVFDELKQVTDAWPKEHEFNPVSSNNQKLKSYTLDESKMGVIADFIHTNFHSQKFIRFLEELTGIKGLVMPHDVYGLHETFKGGSLKPHLDYMIHHSGLQHRVNAILYLEDCRGGELELFKPTGKGGLLISEVQIAAIYNRLVIFNINEKAWHGHTNPVKSDSRKSIALNYFSLPDKDAKDIKTTFGSTKRNIMNVLKKLIK